jgi:hypothetical protein
LGPKVNRNNKGPLGCAEINLFVPKTFTEVSRQSILNPFDYKGRGVAFSRTRDSPVGIPCPLFEGPLRPYLREREPFTCGTNSNCYLPGWPTGPGGTVGCPFERIILLILFHFKLYWEKKLIMKIKDKLC